MIITRKETLQSTSYRRKLNKHDVEHVPYVDN